MTFLREAQEKADEEYAERTEQDSLLNQEIEEETVK